MENNNTALTLLEQNQGLISKLILCNMPKGSTMEDAERIAMREIMNMQIIMDLNPTLLVCDSNSVLLAVKQCISDNLTLSPSAGLVYLYPGRIQTGINTANNAKIYKDVLVYQPTAEGEISIARQSGSILDHKRPVCTYDAEGRVHTVTFEFMVPSYGSPRWERVTFDQSNFEKWKQKSAVKFGGNPNANYTSWKGGIDPEFAGSKAIKHALTKLGTNANEVRKPMVAQHYQPIQQEHFSELIDEKGKQIELGAVIPIEEAKAEPIRKQIDPTKL